MQTMTETLQKLIGKPLVESTDQEIYLALLDLVHSKSAAQVRPVNGRKLYYISAEFLIGKLLSNNLINLGLYDDVRDALAAAGKSLSDIEEVEPEPSLGNGGLGRLAACFLDSLATLNLPGDGIGLRYHFGLFHQRFEEEKSGIPLPENQVEIKGLSRSYQHMINEINALTIKNYETQIQLRRAELMALQSQINPHFIYNTLNSIKWMADVQGSKRMVTALDSLIKLMQFSSKNSREVIRIQDEIDLIRDYINLINLKYFDRIFVDVHVEPGLENCETLKFLLQPIVENSIYHGFSSMVRQCTVQINITRKEDRILYEVIDNGKGMSKEKIRQALEEDHPLNSHSFNKIGLYNVNKRIQYIFGEEYGIQIDSEPGKYTRVIVEIPARIYKEEMANA